MMLARLMGDDRRSYVRCTNDGEMLDCTYPGGLVDWIFERHLQTFYLIA
jgi:hypothetical protein